MDYRSAVGFLYSLQKHGIKLGLDNPIKLMSLLGNPERSFKSIHIAGTNGKGSTSAMAASMLNAGAMKVGLFTSPHLVSFTERIRINNVEIKEEEVVRLTGEISGIIEGLVTPTFFEFVTAMAFLYFRQKAVEGAVVETGMGGRLDATNVIQPQASIITGISLDHKEFLGGSIEEIAYEKAGIIKHKTPVITAPQIPEAMDVISKKAREMGAPLYVEGRDFNCELKKQTEHGIYFDYLSGAVSLKDLFLPLRGRYQAENAGLAIRGVIEAFNGSIQEKIIRDGLAVTKWHGRLELISQNPHILIDAAHNPAGAEALARALKEGAVDKKGSIVLVMGIMADKDIKGIMKPLLPLASQIIFTAPDYERAASPQELQRHAESLGYKSSVANSVKEALEVAVSLGGITLITGSFYTIGEAKEVMGAKGIMTGLRE